MIAYEWRRGFAPDEEAELRAMLAEASEDDAEAGFSRLGVDDPVPDGTAHLLVWLLPDERFGGEQAPSLAAYLRVEPGKDGAADAAYVVRPAYRSRGITTMLLERMDPYVDLHTGARVLRIWARGDHPAALRAATRFRGLGIATSRTRWRLLAPLRPGRTPDAGEDGRVRTARTKGERGAAERLWPGRGRPPGDAEVLVTGDPRLDGAAWVAPHAGETSEYGTAGRITAVAVRDPADAATVRALLAAGMRRIMAAGPRVAAITVDAEDRTLVHEARLLGFAHDRTDVQYTVRNAPRAVRRDTARAGAAGP